MIRQTTYIDTTIVADNGTARLNQMTKQMTDALLLTGKFSLISDSENTTSGARVIILKPFNSTHYLRFGIYSTFNNYYNFLFVMNINNTDVIGSPDNSVGWKIGSSSGTFVVNYSDTIISFYFNNDIPVTVFKMNDNSVGIYFYKYDKLFINGTDLTDNSFLNFVPSPALRRTNNSFPITQTMIRNLTTLKYLDIYPANTVFYINSDFSGSEGMLNHSIYQDVNLNDYYFYGNYLYK